MRGSLLGSGITWFIAVGFFIILVYTSGEAIIYTFNRWFGTLDQPDRAVGRHGGNPDRYLPALRSSATAHWNAATESSQSPRSWWASPFSPHSLASST